MTARKITDNDRARGERIAKLREARGFPKKQHFVDDMARRAQVGELADDEVITRVAYLRLESGEDKFTSEEMQKRLARAFNLPWMALLAYARGEKPLEELAENAGEVPTPTASPPAKAHVVEATLDEHAHRPAALALMRGKFDEEVIESLRLTKAMADHVLTVEDWWAEARRLQAMRDGKVVGEDIEPAPAPDVSLDNLRKLAKRPPRRRTK